MKTFYKDKKTGKEIQDYCEAQVLMIVQLHEYQYIGNKKQRFIVIGFLFFNTCKKSL